MGLAGLTVIGIGSLMITLALNSIIGWQIDEICPGTERFCNGVYWQFIIEYLPTWLYVGQIMVVISMASPVALLRVGR